LEVIGHHDHADLPKWVVLFWQISN